MGLDVGARLRIARAGKRLRIVLCIERLRWWIRDGGRRSTARHDDQHGDVAEPNERAGRGSAGHDEDRTDAADFRAGDKAASEVAVRQDAP